MIETPPDRGPAADFHMAAQRLGGIFPIEQLAGSPQQLYQYFHRHAERFLKYVTSRDHAPPPRRLHFEFLNRPELNACAFIPDWGRTECIGVNSGALAILSDTIQRLLAWREMLPLIGEAAEEAAVCTTIEGWRADSRVHHERLPSGELRVPAVLPKDRLRRATGVAILECAFDFLVAHELAHLRYGHLWLLEKSEAELRQIAEVGQRTTGSLDSQTMEYSADCFAVSWSMNGVLVRAGQTLGYLRGKWNSGVMDEVFNEFERALEVWLTAICVTYWLLGAARVPETEPLEALAYPPRAIRHSLSLGYAFGLLFPRVTIPESAGWVPPFFHELGPHAEDAFQRFGPLYSEIFDKVERGCRSITGLPVDTQGYRLALSAEGERHADRIVLHWNELRPRLEPHAWGDRLMAAIPRDELDSWRERMDVRRERGY